MVKYAAKMWKNLLETDVFVDNAVEHVHNYSKYPLIIGSNH